MIVSLLGCRRDPPLVPIPDTRGISAVECSCHLGLQNIVGIPVVCKLLDCECGALASGACLPPRDDTLCRTQIADAVDTCEIVLGATPDRPDPAGIDLAELEAACGLFDAEGCTLSYAGLFCTGTDLSREERQLFCNDICRSVGDFLDFSLSRVDDRYQCGTVDLISAVPKSLRKEECGLECPAIACDASNLETCTVLSTPAESELPGGSVAHCSLGLSSNPFCRAPDQDPPVLEAGGLLGEIRTRRALARVDPSRSRLRVAEAGEVVDVPLSGTVDLLGEPCQGCPVSLRLALAGEDLTIQGRRLRHIRMLAGTGTTPAVTLDASGSGEIDPGLLSGTVSLEIDGQAGFLTARSGEMLHLSVDRHGRTLSLSGNLSLEGEEEIFTVDLLLFAEIENQPPVADAGSDLTLECTSPAGALAPLDGQAEDLDGFLDLRRVAWYRGPAFDGPGGGALVGHWLQAELQAPLGESTFSLFVDDSHLQQAVDETVVEVLDTTAPSLRSPGPGGPPCLVLPGEEDEENHGAREGDGEQEVHESDGWVVLRVDRDLRAFVEEACDAEPSIEITGAALEDLHVARDEDGDEGEHGHGKAARPENEGADDVVVFPDHVCLEIESSEEDVHRATIRLRARDGSGNEGDLSLEMLLLSGGDESDEAHGEGRCTALSVREVVGEDDPACARPRTPEPEQTAGGCGTAGGKSARVAIIGILALALALARRRT